ncbi:MAG TPA: glycosyl hydrolase [Pilimelia sp.]|nr:glycosyl hydrolase [Pilimelia sp.]
MRNPRPLTAVRRTLAAVVVVVVAATGCSGPRTAPPEPAPSPDLSRRPTPVATRSGPFAAGPVAPPATGAYLGAWVRPAKLSQAGRLSAVRGLEGALDRRLRIVNTYRRFEEHFGTASDRIFVRQGKTIMLSWASGDTRSITSGLHDDLIRAQARRVRGVRAPILLRFRWEMDRPNLRATMWSAADFIAAWRHVREIFAEERVRNASWVWCPTAEGFMRGEAPAFYPGDDAVDWTCVDVYAGHSFRSLGDLLAPFLAWAAQRPKPIILGEFGVARAWGSTQRAAWLRDAARTIKANRQIRAVCYFESNPDGNGAEQQFRLSDDAPAFRAFARLTRDPYFNPGRTRRPAP